MIKIFLFAVSLILVVPAVCLADRLSQPMHGIAKDAPNIGPSPRALRKSGKRKHIRRVIRTNNPKHKRLKKKKTYRGYYIPGSALDFQEYWEAMEPYRKQKEAARKAREKALEGGIGRVGTPTKPTTVEEFTLPNIQETMDPPEPEENTPEFQGIGKVGGIGEIGHFGEDDDTSTDVAFPEEDVPEEDVPEQPPDEQPTQGGIGTVGGIGEVGTQ